jgi:hypothetical protein
MPVTKVNQCIEVLKTSGSSPPGLDLVSASMFEYLRMQPNPVSARDIFNSVKVRKTKKVSALKQLLASRLISLTGAGTKGRPHVYFITPLFAQDSGSQAQTIAQAGSASDRRYAQSKGEAK